MPMMFVTLGKFHQQKMRPGEALPLLIHDSKKLLDRAMPDIDATSREQLLLHQFLTGLPAAVGRKLRATGEMKDLQLTVEQAQLLAALDDQEPAAAMMTES